MTTRWRCCACARRWAGWTPCSGRCRLAPMVGRHQRMAEVPARPHSPRIYARALSARGFRFVGPVIVYAKLQPPASSTTTSWAAPPPGLGVRASAAWYDGPSSRGPPLPVSVGHRGRDGQAVQGEGQEEGTPAGGGCRTGQVGVALEAAGPIDAEPGRPTRGAATCSGCARASADDAASKSGDGARRGDPTRAIASISGACRAGGRPARWSWPPMRWPAPRSTARSIRCDLRTSARSRRKRARGAGRQPGHDPAASAGSWAIPATA